MKYLKAVTTIYDVGEEEILTSSGCTTTAFIAGDNCGKQNHHDKYYNCDHDGHMYYGGQ